jgi:hypothetical protein
MPIKFKQSQATRARGSSKLTITHYWMKGQSVDTLVKELESIQEEDIHGRVTVKKGKGKLKQKILNELVRREIRPYKTNFKVAN